MSTGAAELELEKTALAIAWGSYAVSDKDVPGGFWSWYECGRDQFLQVARSFLEMLELKREEARLRSKAHP